MLKKIFKFIFAIIIICAIIVLLQLLFNGGIETYKADIRDLGFGKWLKEFFVSIWTGFKDTCGIK